MRTIKTVTIEPVFIEFIPEVLEEGKVYISKEYGCAIHNCLCGCGNKTVMPISDKPTDWQLVEEKDGTVSFIGSVGNYNFPCRSHYIITKNKANFV